MSGDHLDPALAQLVERAKTRRVWLLPIIGGKRWTLLLAREASPTDETHPQGESGA